MYMCVTIWFKRYIFVLYRTGTVSFKLIPLAYDYHRYIYTYLEPLPKNVFNLNLLLC